MKPGRILSDEDASIAVQIMQLLDGKQLARGISILISILAATLNRQARNDHDRRMLAEAVRADLHATMMLGSRGVLTDNDPVNLQSSGPAQIEGATRTDERRCRECGIDHIEPGALVDGEPLCWAENDLCSECHDGWQKRLLLDASRYRHLRNLQMRTADIHAGGVFAGRPARGIVLSGEDLDRAVDAEMNGTPLPQGDTLEHRLAECLADIIDTPIMEGKDEVGGFGSSLQIRLGFFRPDASRLAAELLEEVAQ